MNEEMKFCQSCGMPLQNTADFGTEADGAPNQEFCIYCYREGRFTTDCTMDGMIRHCSQFYREFKHPDGRPFTQEEAIADMHRYFPTLKRWKK